MGGVGGRWRGSQERGMWGCGGAAMSGGATRRGGQGDALRDEEGG